MANERRDAERRDSSGGAADTSAPIGAGVPIESQRYQAAVDELRAKGCRCVLRWTGSAAVPLTAAEADACRVMHASV